MTPDTTLERQERLQQAENALTRVLADNAAQGWPGIDRSLEAADKRRQALAWAIGNEALEGHSPPEADSFWAKTMQHVILGNISLNQANALDDIVLGLERL